MTPIGEIAVFVLAVFGATVWYTRERLARTKDKQRANCDLIRQRCRPPGPYPVRRRTGRPRP